MGQKRRLRRRLLSISARKGNESRKLSSPSIPAASDNRQSKWIGYRNPYHHQKHQPTTSSMLRLFLLSPTRLLKRWVGLHCPLSCGVPWWSMGVTAVTARRSQKSQRPQWSDVLSLLASRGLARTGTSLQTFVFFLCLIPLNLSFSLFPCLSLARETTPEIEKRTFVSFVVRFSLALLRGRLSSHSVMSACLAALPAFVSCTLCRRRRIDDWDIVRGNHRGQATEEIGIEKRGKGKDEVLLVDTQIRECPPLPSMVPTTVLWAVTFLAIAYGVLALPSRSSWFLCLEWLSTFRRLLNWLTTS